MPNPYLTSINTPTPQNNPAMPNQVRNAAGGYVFQIAPIDQLTRFLVLGSAGGTYYASEQDLTKTNIDFLLALIYSDEELVLATTAEVSHSGRAYRNSPAIFVTALLFKHGKDKAAVRRLVNVVCRTSTHLFELASYFKALGGWNRSKRKAIAAWYTGKDPISLSYQVIKYRQRNGWTHKDLLRLSHPVGLDREIGNFVLGKESEGLVPEIIAGFKTVQGQTDVKYVLENLRLWPELPWEAIPTQFLKEPEVWKALFYHGQLKGQALVRNITRLARIGAFDDMVFARDYANKLVDEEMIAATRLHPIQYLLASIVHERGQLDRSGFGWSVDYKKDWTSSPVIRDALNAGFYTAFKYVEPAGKRTLIGLDVSGSMSSPAMGLDLSCAELGAAMCMSIARTEPFYLVKCFSDIFRDLPISPSMSFAEILQVTTNLNFGRTDCALPMIYATQKKLHVDTFFVFTDNETWFGNVHPFKALEDYRQKMGIDAKLIVAAATATGSSIANPADPGMLDIAGADANMPKLVAEFSAGRI